MDTVDILKKARENIASPESWTTGSLIEERDGGNCYCALGAVCAVEYPEGLRQYSEDSYTRDAYDVLKYSGAVAALASAIPDGQAPSYATCNTTIVYGFNDAAEHAEVLALFDRAIANEQAKTPPVEHVQV